MILPIGSLKAVIGIRYVTFLPQSIGSLELNLMLTVNGLVLGAVMFFSSSWYVNFYFLLFAILLLSGIISLTDIAFYNLSISCLRSAEFPAVP